MFLCEQVFLFGAGGAGGETNTLGAKGGRHDGKSSGGGGGFTSTCLCARCTTFRLFAHICVVLACVNANALR